MSEIANKQLFKRVVKKLSKEYDLNTTFTLGNLYFCFTEEEDKNIKFDTKYKVYYMEVIKTKYLNFTKLINNEIYFDSSRFMLDDNFKIRNTIGFDMFFKMQVYENLTEQLVKSFESYELSEKLQKELKNKQDIVKKKVSKI